MIENIQINIDWAEAYGWKCPFCGGDIDHSHEERDEEEGYADDNYACQQEGSELCEYASFMVRWSLVRKGANGDALTLARWIDLAVDERYITDPEKASAKERHLAHEKREKQHKEHLSAAFELLDRAAGTLDTEGVLSDDFKAQLHWLKGVAKD